jgi:phage gp46-like protein
MDADVIWNGWPIGSRLWLLRRSAINGPEARLGATQTWVMNYIREALQPFIDRKIASRFEILSVRADIQQIDAVIRVYRGPIAAIDLMYQLLWQGIMP